MSKHQNKEKVTNIDRFHHAICRSYACGNGLPSPNSGRAICFLGPCF